MTTLGQIVDNLGCELGDWADGTLPSAAVVLLVGIDPDGDPILHARFSEGMSWLERVGIIAAANADEMAGFNGGETE